MKTRNLVSLPALALASLLHAQSNVYNVTDETRLEKPNRFGINFETSIFAPWTLNTWNCWNAVYSFEPIVFRHPLQASGGGEDYIEAVKGEPTSDHPGGKTKSPGASYWNQFPDGFWDGAEVRIYRDTGNGIELLREDTVDVFSASEGRIELMDSREPIQRGDLIDLQMTRLAPPMEALQKLPNANRGPQMYFGSFYPVTETSFTKATFKKVPGLTAVLDDSTFAPEGGSTASAKITLPGSTNGEAVGLGHQFINNKAPNRFPEGKTIRVEAWMKQEGMTGPVKIQAGGYAEQEFDVTDEWQQYRFEFDSSGAVPNNQSFLVGSASPGTLWVDNLIVYQTDVEPFAIYPEVMQSMKDLNPGCLRSMSGMGMYTLDAFLTRGFERNHIYDLKQGQNSHGGQGNFSLGEQLEICREIGAEPWIMAYILWSEEDIDHFVEYLAAPADVGYGKRRAADGQIEPWTEVFDHIYVECANETWNPVFLPQAFPADPELCGRLSERLVSRIKANPYNQAQNIRGICPGTTILGIYKGKNRQTGEWNDQKKWSYRAAENFPSMDCIGSAPSGYIGGWDSIALESNNLDDALRNNLFFSARIYEPTLEDFELLRRDLDNNFGMFLYEAGPGYPLPSASQPFTEEVEQINKSLAMGTATLDNFLFVIANDGNMNYFKLAKGNNWTTHNAQGDPQTTYLALQLRNVYAKGELLETEEGEQNTVSLPEMKYSKFGGNKKNAQHTLPAMNNVPLTRLYAFREGDRYSYVAVNRSLTEPQDIVINVPYEPRSEYTEYLLTHEDPAANNRFGLEVDIAESQHEGFSRSFTYTLPPASAVTLVNYAR